MMDGYVVIVHWEDYDGNIIDSIWTDVLSAETRMAELNKNRKTLPKYEITKVELNTKGIEL